MLCSSADKGAPDVIVMLFQLLLVVSSTHLLPWASFVRCSLVKCEVHFIYPEIPGKSPINSRVALFFPISNGMEILKAMGAGRQNQTALLEITGKVRKKRYSLVADHIPIDTYNVLFLNEPLFLH